MLIDLITPALIETLIMVFCSSLGACTLGIPLGVLLYCLEEPYFKCNKASSKTLNLAVNTLRSVPFIILLVALIPFTRLIVGSSIGTAAATLPLTIAAIPFLARLVESGLKELPKGLLDAAHSMGATKLQTVSRFLLPETLPTLIRSITVTTVNLVSYSAMAGTVGGGGLGDLAIRYGYQRFNTQVMVATVVVLIVLVNLIQFFGNWLAKRISH